MDAELKAGDVVNNGFYDIQLIETPRWNDTHNRWMCRGYRWVKTRARWEAKFRLYGWTTLFPNNLEAGIE